MTHSAIILAGGFGSRLQPVVSDLPKSLAPVNGRPFLDFQLNYLKSFGVKKVFLSVGFLANKIKEYYGNNFKGIEIVYVTEKRPLGTGGAIRYALEQVRDKEVFALNGDSFFNLNLKEFISFHQKNNSKISLGLCRTANTARFGTIGLNSKKRIISFKEKSGKEISGLINGGIYILNKDIYLQNTPANLSFSIEKDFFEKQINHLTLLGYESNAYFLDIGIPEDYERAQHEFKEFGN